MFALAPRTSSAAQSSKKGGCNTQGSHVITHRSTNWACWCLTSQIGRDGVHSPEYGRIQWHSAPDRKATAVVPEIARLPPRQKLAGNWVVFNQQSFHAIPKRSLAVDAPRAQGCSSGFMNDFKDIAHAPLPLVACQIKGLISS